MGRQGGVRGKPVDLGCSSEGKKMWHKREDGVNLLGEKELKESM